MWAIVPGSGGQLGDDAAQIVLLLLAQMLERPVQQLLDRPALRLVLDLTPAHARANLIADLLSQRLLVLTGLLGQQRASGAHSHVGLAEAVLEDR